MFRRAEADSKLPNPYGITGEDGIYQLHTYEPDDGAPAGDYQIAVTVRPPNRDTGGGSMARTTTEVPTAVRKGRYANPKTSGLKATIKPVENTLDPIDLTSIGGGF
jgi:hypothetical protein